MKGKGLIAATRSAWRRRQAASRNFRPGVVPKGIGDPEPRKQIVITAEKIETFVIRQAPRESITAFCVGCSAEITCLTMEQAVRLTGLGAREIFLLVQQGTIHAHDTDEGFLLLCPNSVAAITRS